MSKPRFIYESELVVGAEISLSPEESHHLAKVLRLEVGAEIAVIDGRGRYATGSLLSTNGKGAKVKLLSVETRAASSRITVCFGLPKPPALEFILKRVTEVGVARFQPLVTRHSLRHSEWNERRWSKILLEVCKQCQELNFPVLEKPVPLADWLSGRGTGRTLVLFDETDRKARASFPIQAAAYDILVGPEGGWSPEEIALFHGKGAVSYGLGENRLRAEMAALVGAVLIKKDIGEI